MFWLVLTREDNEKSTFPEQQTAIILTQSDGRMSVEEVCRKAGISSRRITDGGRRWEVRRLKVLEEENARLKWMVADLSLGTGMLQDAIRRNVWSVLLVQGSSALTMQFA
jgi:putative transposase